MPSGIEFFVRSVPSMDTKEEKEKSADTAPDPVRPVSRLVGLGLGLTVGGAAAATGLVAGVPAPDLVLRAVCAGVAFRVVGGWCGTAIARSLLQKSETAASGRSERDR